MRFYIFLVVLCTAGNSFAQNLQVRYKPCNPCGTKLNDDFDYGESINFPTESVISDYGIRHVSSGSTFHQAIDYTVRGEEDAKYALQAIAGGTISSISDGDISSTRYIKVGGYGYGHIFGKEKTSPQRYGKFIMAKLDNHNEWAIIDLEFCRCFAKRNGEKVTIDKLDLKFCNTKTFTTTNQIEAGWDIAPLGVSGTPYSHLHLERYTTDTGRKADPNQYVAHAATDFEVILSSETSNDNEVILTYPGTKPTALRVRAKMIGAEKFPPDGYTNVTMSADNVAILLERNPQSPYEEIVGPSYNSRISHGARDDSPITPWSSAVFDSRHKTGFGSWTKSGIKPFAHNDVITPTNLRNEAYDDYYFADIHTRIHFGNRKLMTDIPSNARYNDGIYKLKPVVSDVKDVLYTIPGIDVTIDNFKPFLKSIKVSIDDSPVYNVERIESEGDNKIQDDGFIINRSTDIPIEISEPNQNMKLSIRSSEPMEELTYSYRKVNGNFSAWHSLTATNDDKTQWTAQQLLNVSAGDCYEIKFKGKDTNENRLLSVYDKTNQNDHSTKMLIPTRKATTGSEQWENSASIDDKSEDKVRFCLVSCEGRNEFPDCEALVNIQESVEYESCELANIRIMAGSDFVHDDFILEWSGEADNGAEIEWERYVNRYEISLPAGRYCYKIESIDECCIQQGCIFIQQENLNELMPIELQDNGDFPGYIPACVHSGINKGRITIKKPGIEDDTDFSYLWSNGSNSKSVLLDPTTEEYCVTVTNQITGCTNSRCFTMIDLSTELTSQELVQLDCDYRTYGSIEIESLFIDDNVGSEYGISYLWSNGEDSNAIYGLQSGTYTVTVTSSEVYPKCTREYSFEIEVPENGMVMDVIHETDPCSGGTIEVITASGNSSIVWKNISGHIFPEYNGMFRIEGLRSEIYCYEVSNDCGVESDCIQISLENEPISVAVELVNHSLDCEDETGSIRLIGFAGGVPPYTFLWSNGMSGPQISNLINGIYSITITDAVGCTWSRTYQIEPINSFALIFEEITKSCPGENDGAIMLATSEPVKYVWTGPGGYSLIIEGEDIIHLTDLSPGEYCVTISSLTSNCFKERCYLVEEYPDTGPLGVTYTTSDNCNGTANGEIRVNAHGGAGAYDFQWTDDTGKNYFGSWLSYLKSGNYHLTVTDECGNVFTKTIEVKDIENTLGYTQMEIWLEDREITGDRMKIWIGRSGGSGQFSFKWILEGQYGSFNTTVYVGGGAYHNAFINRNYIVEVTDLVTGCKKVIRVEACDDTNNKVTFRSDLLTNHDCNGPVERLDFKLTITGGERPLKVRSSSGQWITLEGDEYEYSRTTYDGGVRYLYPGWEKGFAGVRVKDYCGRIYEFSREIKCSDICPDNCIKIKKTGSSGCTKLNLGECCFSGDCCDYFVVESTCNDNKKRHIKQWNEPTRGEKIFQGTTNIKDEYFQITSTGHQAFVVYNETTRCVSVVHRSMPSSCRSLIGTTVDWLSETFYGGSSGGNGNSWNSCPKITLSIKANSQKKTIAVNLEFDKVPKEGCQIRIDVNNKTKVSQFQDDINITKDDKNEVLTYHYSEAGAEPDDEIEVTVQAFCPAECKVVTKTTTIPPYVFAFDEDCDKDVINLVYYDEANLYAEFYYLHDSVKVYADLIDKETFNVIADQIEINNIPTDFDYIDFDTNFVYFIHANALPYSKVTRIDRDDFVYDTVFSNKIILNYVKNSQNHNFDFLVFDLLMNQYSIETYTNDMQFVASKSMPVAGGGRSQDNRHFAHQGSYSTVINYGIDSTAVHWYDTLARVKNLKYPNNFDIKKILSLKNGYWLLSGDADGQITIADTTLIFTKRTVISLLLDKDFNEILVKYDTVNNHQSLTDISYDNDHQFYYTYKEVLEYNHVSDSSVTIITDTCYQNSNFWLDLDVLADCPPVVDISYDENNLDCWNITFEVGQATNAVVTYNYWGLNDQERVIVHTSEQEITLDTVNNMISYCMENIPDWFDMIEFTFRCLNCADSCEFSDYLLYVAYRKIYEESEINEDSLNGADEFHVSFIPNPFNNTLFMQVLSGTQYPKIDVSLYDVNGNLRYTKSIRHPESGNTLFALDALDHLPAGMYLARVQTSAGSHYRKVLKIK